MAANGYIGTIANLAESGKALVFKVRKSNGEILPAFAICFGKQLFSYINRCGHLAVPLDYKPGEVFSDDGQTLMCSTHGAEYAPDTGACLGGPCLGVGLEPLSIIELDGALYLRDLKYQMVVDEAAN